MQLFVGVGEGVLGSGVPGGDRAVWGSQKGGRQCRFLCGIEGEGGRGGGRKNAAN